MTKFILSLYLRAQSSLQIEKISKLKLKLYLLLQENTRKNVLFSRDKAVHVINSRQQCKKSITLENSAILENQISATDDE